MIKIFFRFLKENDAYSYYIKESNMTKLKQYITMGRLKYLIEDTTYEITDLSDKWKQFFNDTYNIIFIDSFEFFLKEHKIQDVFDKEIECKDMFYDEIDPIDFLYYFRGINDELYKLHDNWEQTCKILQKQYIK